MWSGDTRSQGGPYSTQWALNPAAYMNVPSEQVDWATLAQQWIKMKEGLPPLEKEGGEAPMDITKDDIAPDTSEDLSTSQQSWTTTAQPIASDTGGWANNWSWDQNSGWCWIGAGSSEGKTAPSFTSSYTSLPTESTSIPLEQQPPQPTFPYSQSPSTHQYSTTPGYWSSESNVKESWEPPAPKVNKKPVAAEPNSELDSNKRKQLPAWIREGLEKMEREKQKKAEYERLRKERLEQVNQYKEIQEEKKEVIETNGSPAVPKKSKFESDSEGSEPENEMTVERPVERPHRSRFDWKPASPPKPPLHRSKEEILQHVMTQVRKILTQLLTEVTTEEMMAVCEQVFSHYWSKAPATTVRKTQALASLTGKLGLGIYDSEESSSESSGEKEDIQEIDSDQELRERIRRKKEEFAETENQIEREIAEQEEKERRVLLGKQSVSREPSPDSEEQVHPPQSGSSFVIKMERKTSRDSSESKLTTGSREWSSKRSTSRERGGGEGGVGRRRESRRRSSEELSSSSSSTSEESRSPSPRNRRRRRSKDGSGRGSSNRHGKDSKRRRSRERGRSRSRSRSRDRSRRGGGRYRSRSSSRKRRRRHRSSSSSSGGGRSKRHHHRR